MKSAMAFWFILALMTGLATFAVIWPLARSRKDILSGSSIAVYRDQLEELDRDLAAGSIGKIEAEAARVEISKRLLVAADSADALPATSTATWHRRAIALAAILFLPLGAAGLYFSLGSPELASERLARGTQLEARASIENLVAKVELYLESNPNDGRGWEVLAPVYMQLGRYTDSVSAWRNTLLILGESADREANLGESLVAEANGVVTVDAKTAFVRAIQLDRTIVSARYYLGVAAEQDGKRAEATEIWRELIAEAPAGAHWLDEVRSALARVETKPAGALSGSSETQAAARPDQQAVMIRGMVDGLAARLKQDGSDVEGWVKLVRSYTVLGEDDKAQAAISDAQQALANEPDKINLLNSGLKQLKSSLAASSSPIQPGNTLRPPSQHESDTIQMVARLAERLKKSGSDPEGWIMLTRSYLTLGEKQKALATIRDARTALADNGSSLQLFNEALQQLKIDESGGAGPAPVFNAAEFRAPEQSDTQTSEMIRGMVTRLADRLKKDGSDFEGWLQLVRSYVVLGERDKAMDAAANARQAIVGDAQKRQRFDEFLKSLGLDG
jgi:cytochrome c-type biogenesis protein CcmH